MNTTKTFHLSGIEDDRAVEFMKEHDKKHGNYAGSIGGRYTFCFTPTSIGVGICIKCSCGVEVDVSDYDSW